MSTKKLTLSLIIPVFNGEHQIKKTLESVASQTVAPDEVIVVDNNCSDNTVNIAKSFYFVKIVHEKKQGLTYARNRGFNEATSDILGRIDVDSLLEPKWVEKVLEQFEEDLTISGIAGIGVTPLIPYFKSPVGTFHMRAYFYNVHSFFRTVIMWGGNMAITRSAWVDVKNSVILGDEKVHEDQDLTLWLVARKHIIKKAYHIRVTSYDQSFRYLPKMISYVLKRNKTARTHKKIGNLPVKTYSLSNLEVLGSHFLELPALGYGLTAGVLTLPIDFVAVKIFKAKHWFD